VTLNAHRRRDRKRCLVTRVWLNGVEVTNRCFYADGRRGVVRLYKLNPEGKKYVENAQFLHWNVPKHLRPRVATEEVRGKVRWGLVAV
jgi:hypothetical protein